jgi:hypothetical protein
VFPQLADDRSTDGCFPARDDGWVIRRMLESGVPESKGDRLPRELIVVPCAYLDACSARVPVESSSNAMVILSNLGSLQALSSR